MNYEEQLISENKKLKRDIKNLEIERKLFQESNLVKRLNESRTKINRLNERIEEKINLIKTLDNKINNQSDIISRTRIKLLKKDNELAYWKYFIEQIIGEDGIKQVEDKLKEYDN